MAKEVRLLLNESNLIDYNSKDQKKKLLWNYLESVRHFISGKKEEIAIETLITDLEEKSEWLMEHIRKQEWLAESEEEGWFNSYYDNHKNQVEGHFENGVRMMLTGQVFAIMSGTADQEQVRAITKAADHYLFREKAGGYRLNTDFHELKFDMGRMFGFAYGEKENGATFSHMAVMYANALYRRGYAKEGYKALKALADAALDFDRSKIFPWIPEYFNAEGRGLYHYLTGAASWYMLTVITEMFGIKGNAGNLEIRPQLMKEQFDEDGVASMILEFSGKKFRIAFQNRDRKDYGDYVIKEAECNGYALVITEDRRAVMLKSDLDALGKQENQIRIVLG